MKPNSARGKIGVLLLLLALSGMTASIGAYIPMRMGFSGIRLLNAPSRFPMRLAINSKTASGTTNLSAGSDPLGAFRAAMSAWQSLPTASISFADLDLTSQESTNPDDGVNLVTMVDTPINRLILGGNEIDPGPLALTRVVFNKNTGKISDTDIIFNPRYVFSTTLASDTYDLQAVATHEIGHALGCDHASAQNDTMFFLTGQQEFFQRYLSADLVAFATLSYPNPSHAQSLGRIFGRVTSRGKGVFGAAVTAMDVDHNLIYTGFSDPDGSYTINGPIPGRYVIYAEPLDGPAAPDQLLGNGAGDGYYNNLNTTFRTSFAGESDAEDSIGTAQADGTITSSNADIVVSDRASTVNVDRMGRGDVNGFNQYLAVGAVLAYPGEDLTLVVGGANTWKVADADDVKILGTGVQINKARAVKIVNDSRGRPAGFSILIHVAADASPGPRTIAIEVGDEEVASTGGLLIGQRSLPALTMHMPYMLTSPDQYTGVALANPSALPATVRLISRDTQGALLYDNNAIIPNNISIAPGAQTARLERQIFNLPANSRQSGSITVETDTASLRGFFLAGDLKGTYLDGGEAFTRAYKQLYFPDVLQNAFTTTELHLMNVKDEPVTVLLSLVGGDGRLLAGPIARSISAGGKIGDSVRAIFGYSGTLSSCHVTAAASDESLVGFMLVRQPGSVFGLNAQPAENAGATVYSPHLAVGNFGVNFSTRINIVNVGDVAAQIQVSLHSDNGLPVPGVEPQSQTLSPRSHLSVDANSFFSLPPETTVQGSIKVVSDPGSRLLGNIVFGDGDPTQASLGFEAALPLSATGSTSFLFSQVAQGQGFYTGLAFFAPAGATVRVEVFAQDGTPTGSTSLTLAPGTRKASLLRELIASTEAQVGGYVKVTSSNPVIAFELFGGVNGEFLSAVPPQKLN